MNQFPRSWGSHRDTCWHGDLFRQVLGFSSVYMLALWTTSPGSEAPFLDICWHYWSLFLVLESLWHYEPVSKVLGFSSGYILAWWTISPGLGVLICIRVEIMNQFAKPWLYAGNLHKLNRSSGLIIAYFCTKHEPVRYGLRLSSWSILWTISPSSPGYL